MIEYFLLKTDATTSFKPTDIDRKLYQNIMNKENFDKLPKDAVGYYQYSDEVEMPDVMLSPTLMVGRRIYNIIKLYDDSIPWKSLQIFPDMPEFTREKTKSYWIPCLPECKCLHKDAVILPNGTVQEVILERKNMRNLDIFRVSGAGIHENLVVISLALAESINRRNVYGVAMERIEVK